MQAIELLPFVVFVALTVMAYRQPITPARHSAVKNASRHRNFCRFTEGERLVMCDPDGTPLPHLT